MNIETLRSVFAGTEQEFSCLSLARDGQDRKFIETESHKIERLFHRAVYGSGETNGWVCNLPWRQIVKGDHKNLLDMPVREIQDGIVSAILNEDYHNDNPVFYHSQSLAALQGILQDVETHRQRIVGLIGRLQKEAQDRKVEFALTRLEAETRKR